MIEIKLANEDAKKEISEKFSYKASPLVNIYTAKENGKYLGACGFEKEGGRGKIVFSGVEDDSLKMIEDGLLRASLSYFYECGVKTVSCGSCVEPIMLKRLGFREKDGLYILDLENSFLTKGCCK